MLTSISFTIYSKNELNFLNIQYEIKAGINGLNIEPIIEIFHTDIENNASTTILNNNPAAKPDLRKILYVAYSNTKIIIIFIIQLITTFCKFLSSSYINCRLEYN